MYIRNHDPAMGFTGGSTTTKILGMPPQIPVRGLVFDLGDVLFTWSRSTKTTISPGTLKKILSSSIWYEYERGKISQSICYELVALEFSLEASEVAEAFSQARASLQPDPTVVKFLKNLRRDSSVKIFAMSNVAIEDFASLSDKMDPSIFHQVFTSGEAGMRKPDLGFYRQVLEKIDLAPEQVVFVDDKHENVLAANNLGIRGLVFDKSTLHTLQSIFQGPVAKAHDYLYRHAKDFDSITDSGVRVGDNFAKLLILEATQDPSVVPPNLSNRSSKAESFLLEILLGCRRTLRESGTSSQASCWQFKISNYIYIQKLTDYD